ncbi:hypothetical protein SODALDRAFT_105546 [Sodiomyces alkalinus F11]|uniref:Ribonucleases P/MRP subunit Pop8-like domain-containing protein n=1 Tax=Sodiomyces alkalinus (strain CBS 110278 / VKM F-3762 / F11) TaxID=1314773 RepID=A0A3N2Q2C1_SODAK|nr:hypothetical protein SODALDRAFT_105546 [Sodiomyces alkalinus F11]ROT40818.1 hypothetical protein SODALDRAFT_105546 [Sodiomyces alkalinus F11]
MMSTQSQGQSTSSSIQKHQFNQKSHELLSCTAKSPSFSYVHLEVVRSSQGHATVTETDHLQIRSYCTSALQQSLGATGVAIPIDILKVHDNQCWLRIPRQDLAAFSASMTAWSGTRNGGEQSMLRIRQCSDWLGSMVGAEGQDKLWG